MANEASETIPGGSIPLDSGIPGENLDEVQIPPSLAPEMIRMVRALAGNLHARLPQGCCLEVGDLVQAGNIGLLKAVRTFESGVGAPLVGYAKFRVRGEMLDLVRRHMGRTSTSSGAGVNRAPGPGPQTGAEVSREVPAAVASSPQVPLFSRERSAIIHQEVERLPVRYRAIVRLRYSGELTLREIGNALKVNESRACQLHQKALLTLKSALRSRGVSDFSQV